MRAEWIPFPNKWLQSEHYSAPSRLRRKITSSSQKPLSVPSDFKFLPSRGNCHLDFCDDNSVTTSLFFLIVLPHICKHVSLFSFFVCLKEIMLIYFFISCFSVQFLHVACSVAHSFLFLYSILLCEYIKNYLSILLLKGIWVVASC